MQWFPDSKLAVLPGSQSPRDAVMVTHQVILSKDVGNNFGVVEMQTIAERPGQKVYGR